MTELQIKDFSVVIERPIFWGEMDAFAHVNSCNFIKYFEDVRVEYCSQTHYLEEIAENKIGIVVSSVTCRYLKPLQYPDIAVVGVKLGLLEEKRFNLEYGIFSKSTGKLSATGETLICSYDYKNQRSTKVPDRCVQAMKKLRGDFKLPNK